MKFFKNKRTFAFFISATLLTISLFSSTLKVQAETDYNAEADARKSLPIETNQLVNWPSGPQIGAESAILLEANSGAVLYAKNIDEKLYPASVTKILTALIAVENSDMNDMVTFSNDAVHSIDWREDANMGINVGDQITMEQCLYGLLVGSANEAAYAIAEHICGEGNVEEFSNLMNSKAKELGCTNSNFVTPNGIHSENHYTSAHDLGLIAQAFFSNELLCKMSSTTSYQIPQTSTQQREDMIVWAKSKLLPGKEYAYEDLVGTKTGFTTQARQTLVSCAQKNGMKLICVILKEESPGQFTDTIELFDYGFQNFNSVLISEKDTQYIVDNLNFFSTNIDFLGSSKPILEIDPDDYIVLPITVEFDETQSEITYDNLNINEIARINYTYNGINVGYASVIPVEVAKTTFDFGTKQVIKEDTADEQNMIYINIKNIIILIITIAIFLIIIFMIRSLISNTRKYKKRSKIIRKHKINNHKLDWKHFK